MKVYWKEVDGQVKQFEYDIITDGKPHDTNYNGHMNAITATEEGHTLKVAITSHNHSCIFEADGHAKKMQLHMKYLKENEGKWVNIYQTYTA